MESFAYLVAAENYERTEKPLAATHRVNRSIFWKSIFYCLMAAVVIVIGGLGVVGVAVSASPPPAVPVDFSQQ